MYIYISERLKPFSHKFGMFIPLPLSTYALKIFPTAIHIYDLSKAKILEVGKIDLPITGPVVDFTAQLDLEKALIRVWGKDSKGFFRYTLRAENDLSLMFDIEKGLNEFSPNLQGSCNLKFTLGKNKFLEYAQLDRLSLGNHKAQDWDLVKRRLNLEEILPIWLKLAQLFEGSKNKNTLEEGTFTLLKKCEESTPANIYQNLENLFQVGFTGLFVPRLNDDDYQGFDLPQVKSDLSTLDLLVLSAKVIRELFVKVKDKEIILLPKAPSEFQCGRFLHVRCDAFGLLDIEWTKSKVRRMYFYAEVDDVLLFSFPKEIASFRLNGKRQSVQEPVQVCKGQVYYIDRFEK